MHAVSQAPAGIAFRRFLLLPHRRKLLADGRPVKLGGRAFDVLMTLIEARGAADPHSLRAWLSVHRRDPHSVGEAGAGRNGSDHGGSRIGPAADQHTRAGFRGDRPGGGAQRHPESRRHASARHSDRCRRHREDDPGPRTGTRAAAALCRRRVAGRVFGPRRSRAGPRHRGCRCRAGAGWRRSFGAACGAGARRSTPIAGVRYLRAM